MFHTAAALAPLYIRIATQSLIQQEITKMMNPQKIRKHVILALKGLAPLLFLLWLFLVMRQDANAVPSYSRQTGLPCSSCHLAPPELNAFGRKFKLDGYTFATKPVITDDKDKKDHSAALQLLEAFPLSVD